MMYADCVTCLSYTQVLDGQQSSYNNLDKNLILTNVVGVQSYYMVGCFLYYAGYGLMWKVISQS